MWCNIKTKSNPGPLHSHAVCKLPSSMLIFGGETNGLLLNDLWRFHFGKIAPPPSYSIIFNWNFPSAIICR